MASGSLLYAQSGGVTAVINATASAVIGAARARRVRVLAARNGILGALREDLIDTTAESAAAVKALAHTPGGAFGSCRVKLGSLEEDRASYERLLEVLRAHDVRWFLYNGGNDSADTALKVSTLAAEFGYPLTCIGVPKTVDNDLPVTDCCPGFGSAARYTAVSVRECALDVAAVADTSTRVFVYEAMGRNAGWLAASAGLAGRDRGRGAAPDPVPRAGLRRGRVSRQGAGGRRPRRALRRGGERGAALCRRPPCRRRRRAARTPSAIPSSAEWRRSSPDG